jgi:seryl-tRNA synthetase
MISYMLDLKFIRDNLPLILENTKKRNVDADPQKVVALYEERNRVLQNTESLRQKRKRNAKAMKAKLADHQRQAVIEEGKNLKQEIARQERSLEQLQQALEAEAVKIPNLSHPDAPVGRGEQDNLEIKRWGEPRRFDFEPKDHVEIGQNLDLIDFETAARISGTKFYYLKNEAVFLEQALLRYGLDLLKQEGFTLTTTPDVAKEEVVEGIGFNPRGEESNIYTLEGTGTCLIGTAEITLGGYFAGQILESDRLPVKMAGLSHCFRREAGAAGQYSRGLYRVHQFTKLEMFIFCHPGMSERMHSYLLELEERIYQDLNIPYRVIDTCTGELGGPAYRKYDIEAWMPGRNDWGEITSASNCTDYQARRLGIRFKEEGKIHLVHMLNGTAIAVSRTLVSILENFQQGDGSVRIPKALVPYTGFEHIAPRP